jgi:O-antigen/teichoic acid export membrane protein
MSLLRTNVLANYAGQAWMAIMAVAFVPLYAKALGFEAFGLVGLMLSIQAISMLLDLGMGGVMNRELARRAASPVAAGSMRDLTRTLELLLWPIALGIAVAVACLAPWAAAHWLHPQNMTTGQTTYAIRLMGLAVAAQWPSAFYTSGLSGLERQPAANVVNAAFATLRGAGSVVVLFIVSNTIDAFMAWQAMVGIAQSLVAGWALHRALPSGPSRFRLEELRSARRFAGGVIGIAALSIALIQLDRVLLSALRPLSDLGYFTLALTVSAGLGRLAQPMFNATYPRFSRLVALGQPEELRTLYHNASQYLLMLLAAACGVLIAFPRSLLFLWTGDSATADMVAMPMVILVIGTALNGLMNLPYALQLAHGWTSLSLGLNAFALVASLAAGIPLVMIGGITGAAWLWVITNAILVVVGLPLMHRRLLVNDLGPWFRDCVAPPVIGAALVSALFAYVSPPLTRDVVGFVRLAGVIVMTLLATILSLPLGRRRSAVVLRTLIGAGA